MRRTAGIAVLALLAVGTGATRIDQAANAKLGDPQYKEREAASKRLAELGPLAYPALKEALRNKVLLPILGDQYGRILERGEFHLTMSDGKTPHGLFTLIFRKFPNGWKIVHDHSAGE
jgi:hypothetical protein